MQPEPIAVVDIGSNTVHLLVARSDGRDLEPIADMSVTLSLGREVEVTGGIGPAKLVALLDALQILQTAAVEAGAPQIHLVATEAIRAAQNGDTILAAVADTTGLAATVLPPDQEAALAFAGATLAVPGGGSRVMVDIGGGSIQVVVGEGAAIGGSVSLPLGGARLAARLLPGDPPDAEAEARLAAYLAETIPPALPRPAAQPGSLIGVGGALRQLPGLLGAVLNTPLPPEALDRAAAMLRGKAADQLAAQYGLDAARTHLLLPAILIMKEAMRGYGGPALTISAYGLREGLLLALARRETSTGGHRP